MDGLILLVGPSGSGKSTWAQRNFGSLDVLSSDEFRAMVSGDPGDQSASPEAFSLLHGVVRARMRRGLRTVVDATNLAPRARHSLLRIAARASRPVVAVVFDLTLERCLAWNAARPGRQVPEAAVREQHARLRQALRTLPGEGYEAVLRLREEDLRG